MCKLSEKLYRVVMENGILSSKENVMDVPTIDRIENKVYVKKLPIEIPTSGTTVMMVSVAGSKEDLSDTRPADVRVGCVNRENKWTNVFAEELPEPVKRDILFFFDIQKK